ncbi:hypothetical protein C5C66_00505 [Rathayibacter toxicus]|uniref:Cellulose biosynthesis cyclic di-GMP-binding regulatory protein BcsB n=1 Tax=Rathayibacter toxicus TaxID=145458 RepID=A0A0C5B810_9MICO|nr:hypothetical protein [Rathayibacter toxicus]AJM76893.1 hypothetical protein TI83_00695 [Rathayibacter toxicus]ALS57337.1 hypothetical protein APU90_05785 [Rathayibacter toxicus]KKM45696.1 hypothetical protein VT73_05925 [Rathayibacter toxicus]PPG24784.1 hypothetical protein C5D15_00495 [Rathayibacter toxicus]PPG48239.1 hypothetical protein C5D16_00510 [Rathayibacter toxicus]
MLIGLLLLMLSAFLRRSLLSVFAALFCVGLVLVPVSAVSAADLVDPATGATVKATPSVATTTVTAGELLHTMKVPVTDGIAPTRVLASVAARAPFAGSLSVVVGGRTVLTTEASATTLDVPVRATDEVNGALEIGFQLSAASAGSGARCETADRSLTISTLGIVGDGVPSAPTTVGGFFSDTVTAVSIVVPDSADDALRAAGLSAAASLASRYPSRVAIAVGEKSGTEGLPRLDAATGRIVRFETGEGPVATAISTEAGIPVLTLKGAEDGLAPAGAALGSTYSGLASRATTSGLAQKVIPSSSLEHTLADFGADRLALRNSGSTSSYTTITQSAFGGPVSSIDLHLVGTHSAIPAGITATANIYWNDFLIGSTVLGADTAIDLPLSVPGERLASSNALAVRLSAVHENGGQCIGAESAVPIEFFVDGARSRVTGVRGESTAPGFSRFPQVFGGALPVAFGASANGADALRSAGALVTALQRVDPHQLAISVVGLGNFIGSDRSGLVVGAGSDEAETLRTPLRLASFTAIHSARFDYGVGTQAPYAALEAFTVDRRDILLLGGWSPHGSATESSALQASVADSVGTKGWTSLAGNLEVSGSTSADPVQIDSNEITPQAEVKDDYSSYAVWCLVVLVLLGALIVTGWLVRRRRSRRVAAYVDAQERAATSAGGGAPALGDSSGKQPPAHPSIPE